MSIPTAGRVAAATMVVLCVSGGLSLSGQQQQQPPSPPPPTPAEQLPEFRSGVELVTIDVGVVDRQGLPVRGLAPTDFTVTVGSETRRVVTAEFVELGGTQSDPRTLREASVISSNEGGGVGRLVVFVVDQNTLEAGSFRYVATASSRFFDRLSFADRSALVLIPVGQNIGFTWAHDRVKEALLHVTGTARPSSNWEYGSLAEARDIANRNLMTFRAVGERECRGNIFASNSSGGGIVAPSGGSGSGPAPPANSGPAPGGNGGGGGGGGAANGGGAGNAGGGTGGGTSSRTSGGSLNSFGMDPCTRDLQMQAEATWRDAEMTSQSSIAALRQVITGLAKVQGDKSVILISGGWPLDEREEISMMSTVAAEAAAARITFFSIYVPGSTYSADRRGVSMTPTRDQYVRLGPLETVSGMTGGASYRAEVNAESTFDRLGRELGGYYRIGVEKSPTDLESKNRRMKVAVARPGATVRARDVFDIRTYEDRDWAARMASALESPVPATSVGVRMTSYVAQDPDDRGQIRLVLIGNASRLRPGPVTFQVLVRDLAGKKVAAGEQPLGETAGDTLPFSTNLSLPLGSYIVRVAIMDGEGRVGSVDHRVEARPTTLGTIGATGPLLVRVPNRTGAEARFAVDTVQQDERLALEVDLEGAKDPGPGGTDVAFEIASTADGPALVRAQGHVTLGSREGSLVAQAVADVRVLPPGEYIARARVTSGGDSLGDVHRAFTLVETTHEAAGGATAGEAAAAGATVSAPALSARAAATIQRFALDQVLDPSVLNGFLDRVAARPDAATPAMRSLLDRARASGVSALDVSDAEVEAAPVAAFLKGLTLLSEQKLDPAATAFRTAMRGSADFYPAMVYLGACYAAGGNDKEAAGAWRTALIKEGDVMPLYGLLADALLRQGRGDVALQPLDAARARWPEDEATKRRFVTASLMVGRYADGLQAIDELVALKADDEATLALGLHALYDAFTNHRPVQTVDEDRARMLRLADAYHVRGGPSEALVESWVAAVTGKR
jgi:VWFA-related protein